MHIHMDEKHFINRSQYDGGRNSLEILSSYKRPKRSVKEAPMRLRYPSPFGNDGQIQAPPLESTEFQRQSVARTSSILHEPPAAFDNRNLEGSYEKQLLVHFGISHGRAP